MDGVLIDTERTWGARENELLTRVFGSDVVKKIGNTVGTSITTMYKIAHSHGATIDYESYKTAYDEASKPVYAEAAITEGVDALAARLRSLGFRLGLVTSSPQNWVDRVLPRLSFSKHLEVVLSLFDHPTWQPKPAADGYIEALRRLDADPSRSFVLEDSETGIRSGKDSGAFVICFTGNHERNYRPSGADAYANTMEDVIRLVESFDGN